MNVVGSLPASAPYTPYSSRGAFNTDLANAQAESNLRYNTKPLDRAGMSRAAGQQYMAGIASARNLADGLAQAYGNQASQATSTASRKLSDNIADESLGLGSAGIAQQDAYARALNALQRQQMMLNFSDSALSGLLGGGDLTNLLGF